MSDKNQGGRPATPPGQDGNQPGQRPDTPPGQDKKPHPDQGLPADQPQPDNTLPDEEDGA